MTDEDSYLWLEDVEGADALAWVAERNAETLAALTRGPGFEALRRDVREALDAGDRIPYTVRRGPFLYDFWCDAEHPKGLWRRTTLEQYRKDAPEWELLLDVDALGADEGVEWVWDGAQVRYPDHRRALVTLSREGADAVVVREFDLGTKAFVPDGFEVGEAKTRIGWIDADHVYVGTDTGPGSLTDMRLPPHRTPVAPRHGPRSGAARLRGGGGGHRGHGLAGPHAGLRTGLRLQGPGLLAPRAVPPGRRRHAGTPGRTGRRGQVRLEAVAHRHPEVPVAGASGRFPPRLRLRGVPRR